MTENARDTQHTPYDQSPVNEGNMTISHAALLADMEQVFTEARPRLLRLATFNCMEHLSPDTRKLLELYYLAEIPQREVALQLGLTIGALELRLHRARKQLRQVLGGALRADAESFGLALDPVQVQGWRETRQWCWLCGKHRMMGIFETLPNGRVALRLRCPAFFNRYGYDVINSHGLVSMAGLSSFRPALKRLYQKIGERFWIPLTKGICIQCHGSALISIID